MVLDEPLGAHRFDKLLEHSAQPALVHSLRCGGEPQDHSTGKMLQDRQIALRQDVVCLVDQDQLRFRRFGQPAADRLHHTYGTEREIYAACSKSIGNLLAQLLAVNNKQYPVTACCGAGGDVALYNGLAQPPPQPKTAHTL